MTVDVILSGEAKPSANRQPAWIVKEGLFTDDVIGNFVDPEMGTGRVACDFRTEEVQQGWYWVRYHRTTFVLMSILLRSALV